mmetsp:Transcript_65249/g.185104  ORF Transcript_65249/g.185104 Transcript_65249/m.185104 type:complete len:227 (+) Transcript_65249:971-1651(+)
MRRALGCRQLQQLRPPRLWPDDALGRSQRIRPGPPLPHRHHAALPRADRLPRKRRARRAPACGHDDAPSAGLPGAGPGPHELRQLPPRTDRAHGARHGLAYHVLGREGAEHGVAGRPGLRGAAVRGRRGFDLEHQHQRSLGRRPRARGPRRRAGALVARPRGLGGPGPVQHPPGPGGLRRVPAPQHLVPRGARRAHAGAPADPRGARALTVGAAGAAGRGRQRPAN